jgi:hypothetical protein
MSAENQNCEASRDSRCQGTGSANKPVAWQWLSSRHVMAATDTHTRIGELLEAVFSLRPVLRLYNEKQLPLRLIRERGCRKTAESFRSW